MRFLSRVAKFWVLLAFAASTGYFWIHNQDRMPLHIPPWIDHASVPAWLGYTSAFMVGIVVTTCAFGLDTLGKSIEIRRLRKALKSARSSGQPWDGSPGDGDRPMGSRPASALSATGSSGMSSLS